MAEIVSQLINSLDIYTTSRGTKPITLEATKAIDLKKLANNLSSKRPNVDAIDLVIQLVFSSDVEVRKFAMDQTLTLYRRDPESTRKRLVELAVLTNNFHQKEKIEGESITGTRGGACFVSAILAKHALREDKVGDVNKYRESFVSGFNALKDSSKLPLSGFDLGDFLEPNRMVPVGELKSLVENSKSELIDYVDRNFEEDARKPSNISSSLISLLEDEKAADGKIQIATIFLSNRNHFVHIARKGNDLCLLDTLNVRERVKNAGVKDSGDVKRNDPHSAFDGLKRYCETKGVNFNIVWRDIQNEDGLGNCCSIFGKALGDFILESDGDRLNNRMNEIVKKFATDFEKMELTQKKFKDDLIRLEMLSAVLASTNEGDPFP